MAIIKKRDLVSEGINANHSTIKQHIHVFGIQKVTRKPVHSLEELYGNLN